MLSDFLILYTTAATSSLSVYSPHLQRASFRRFHPAASLFISATLSPTSSSVFFFQRFSFMCKPPTGQWATGLSCCPLRSCKHLHLSSNPYLVLFVSPHCCGKSCCCSYCSLCNLPCSPPQICQVRLNLSSQVALADNKHACASE